MSASAGRVPAEPARSGREAVTWLDRALAWRDRLLALPDFHRLATRLPLTRLIARRQSRRLFDLCAGFVYAQVLAACVQLRVFEILAEGPRTVPDLAARLGLPPDATARLLEAATALDLVERRGGGRFGLGLLGAASLGNPGVAAMVAHHATLYADLADPVALLRGARGRASLARYWPYAGEERELTVAETGPYTALMAATQPLISAQILDAYPVRRHRSLMDVGGGDGSFLLAASRRAPDLRLVLFDLPPVARMAAERFAREGLDARARAVGGRFEEGLPTGSDLVTLVRVLHDHDDGPALALLRAVRAALPPGGTILVAEPMVDGRGTEPVGAYFSFYLAAMGSGRPRSPAEITALLRSAGFDAVRRRPTANPLLVSVVTARRSNNV